MGLRLFNIYGPRQDPNSPYSGVISVFLDRARQGKPLVIHGDGGQCRDFLHVADTVRGFRAGLGAASADAPVVNLCTGQPTTVRELADHISALAERAPPVEHAGARAADIRRSIGDPAEADRRLGWKPRIDLPEGLRRTWDAMSSAGTR
jgi:UDP-glucose 4-epimerase